MTPQEISDKWLAKDGEIRPTNIERDKFEDLWPHQQEVVKQHTYPCPTLKDGEYSGEDLDWQLQMWAYKDEFSEPEWIDTKYINCVTKNRTTIRLKQSPTIDAGQTVEGKQWVSVEDIRNVYDLEAKQLIKELQNDDFAAKHIPVEDKNWQDGYRNGYIIGKEKGHALKLSNLVSLDEVVESIKSYYNNLHSWEDANPLNLITQIKNLKDKK